MTYIVAFPYDDEALGTLGPGTPQVGGAWQTPWRFVAVARTAARVAGTTLATDLGVPCALDDTSWVRPGAATFSWMMDHNSPKNLEQTLRWFDLADAMGWPYALTAAQRSRSDTAPARGTRTGGVPRTGPSVEEGRDQPAAGDRDENVVGAQEEGRPPPRSWSSPSPPRARAERACVPSGLCRCLPR
ncbi:hypothetical protein [Streptomyces aurantiogriseus]|uniref:Uncharacterized protein n=1 Tax=Streptomyces aurantiogriseus TaxID=66870 RepID=A0A918CK67_9ACTN|nr:hypothetical protein [Streptomyces aurantiogriseus]GGR27448.1 hypothetical protein GCM10010251_49190 [Streptomyces aurantiogriseus]